MIDKWINQPVNYENKRGKFIEPLYQLDWLKENRFILNYGVDEFEFRFGSICILLFWWKIFFEQMKCFFDLSTIEIRKKVKVQLKEDCDEIFDKQFIEVGDDFYFSQYEDLLIKLFLFAYRKTFSSVSLLFSSIKTKWFSTLMIALIVTENNRYW